MGAAPAGVAPGALTPYEVLRFREKPDVKTAEQFVAAGNFYWNAGMFFWRAETVLESLESRHELPVQAAEPPKPRKKGAPAEAVDPPEAPRRKAKLRPQIDGPSLFGDPDASAG